MLVLEVSRLSRQEDGRSVVNEVSFTQAAGEKLALVGATGSGKTTLLKLIGGLAQPHSGVVLFENKNVVGPEDKLLPGHPHIAYLSQHFELHNHYRVIELLEKASQLSETEATLIYAICRIEQLLTRWSNQLSGGERQRVALALALVTAPRLLLLDEPYSNLDAFHKNSLKAVVEAICDQLGITCILISHDPLDVLAWADKIVVLQKGRIIQKGTPAQIYTQPASEYTAALFGKYTLLTPALAKSFSAVTDLEMSSLSQFFRPHHFKLVQNEAQGLKADVTAARYMGTHYELELNVGGTRVIANHVAAVQPGSLVFVALV